MSIVYKTNEVVTKSSFETARSEVGRFEAIQVLMIYNKFDLTTAEIAVYSNFFQLTEQSIKFYTTCTGRFTKVGQFVSMSIVILRPLSLDFNVAFQNNKENVLSM